MKISKWEDLNNIEISHHRKISYGCGYICIHAGLGETALVVDTITYPKDVVCNVLRFVGFDIEFEELPKLSKREWHLVNYLHEDWWIARDRLLYAFQSKPKKRETGYVCGQANDDYIRLPKDLFPFVTPDREWSVKELRELEVEK